MKPHIEQKEAFRIIGVHIELPRTTKDNFSVIPAFWQKVTENGTVEKLLTYMDKEPKGVLGLVNEESSLYYVGVASDKEISTGFTHYQVPAATYAIFSGRSSVTPEAILDLTKRIYTNWLPSSTYEHGMGPDVEVYFYENGKETGFEIWIPIVPKEK